MTTPFTPRYNRPIQSPTDQPGRQRTSLWVLGSLLFLCVLISSGRLTNVDTPGLIDAAVRWYDTGSPSAPAPFGVAPFAWLQAPNGKYYESHDLGGTAAMWVAVAASHHLSPGATTYDAFNPVTRWCASVLTNVMNAFTLWFIFLACSRLTTLPRAIGWTTAMLFGTFFVGYCRMVFDMSGAALGMAIAVYFSAKVIDLPQPRFGDLLGVAVGMAISVFFRFSLFPTAGLTLGLLCLLLCRKVNWLVLAGVMAVLLVGMTPSMAYNKLRSGKPLDPPNHTDQLGPNKLRTDPVNIAKGLTGLTFGPNCGYFVFAPWLIPVLLVPFRWKGLPRTAKHFAIVWVPGMLGYVFLLSMVSSWGGPGGWGPRYLLPAIGVGVVLLLITYPQTVGGFRGGRAVFGVLLTIGLAINLPAAVVNIRAAGYAAPYNLAQGVMWPANVASVWRAVGLELLGLGVSNERQELELQSGSYEAVEIAGAPVVFDVPLIRDGLTHPGGVRLVVLTFLAGGIFCCGMTFRSFSHSLKLAKDSE